ncbi:hypothetical protein F8M41_024196 [Gigaspora margarita]|uniref:Uncharacterized protein n=2 Tax=Gigaspora margarita TaxID=4874 RepID=A0A8H4AC54_GIGMA|nr:hypothetical protein F8M41_024196 [Gigaspora margarita]
MIGTTIFLLIMSYIVYLIFKIVTDKPVIQLTHEYLDKLSIPDLEICCNESDIQITKYVFMLHNWTSTTFDNCTKFIQRSRVENNIYCYLFENNYTNNITNMTSKFLSVGDISVQLMDSNFDLLWKGKAASTADLYENQIFKLQMNAFSGIQNMSTLAYFTKQTIQTILPNDISAIFGTTPNYHSITYLNIASRYYPMHPNENVSAGNFHGHFNVAPGSFIHDIQTEKLSHTVLIALGVLGGGFGLISGIYFLLFGRPRNNPWGLMHFLMKQKIETDSNMDLLNMPFVSNVDSLHGDQIPTERKVARLENRILALEKILEDYVFNPYALRLLALSSEESLEF